MTIEDIRRRAAKRPLRGLTDVELTTLSELQKAQSGLLQDKYGEPFQTVAELAERELDDRALRAER